MILIYLQQDLRLSLERVFSVSVEHNLADKFEKNDEFEIFKEKCLQSQFQGIDNKEKLCFFTNLYAINPFTDKDIPIVFTNYVLMGYGTGLIFGCPAHDKRDFEFAEKYNFKILNVIEPTQTENKIYLMLILKRMPNWLIQIS